MLKEIKPFFENCKAIMIVKRDLKDWINVGVWLKQEWLFNLLMYRMIGIERDGKGINLRNRRVNGRLNSCCLLIIRCWLGSLWKSLENL